MVDGFFCILDFPKFSGGGPSYKGNTSINSQNLSSTTTAAKGKKKKKKKKPESPRFVLRISVISPTFLVLMDLHESLDHLWFPKYPECSSGLKEVKISSIFSTFCMQLRMCVDE